MTEREQIMKEFGLYDLTDEQLIRCLANQLRRCVEVLQELDRARAEVDRADVDRAKALLRQELAMAYAKSRAKEEYA